MNTEIDQLLHDADRKVMGAEMAGRMRDAVAAVRMAREAVHLYRRALRLDPEMADPAWRETGNRDKGWLQRHGFQQIAAIEDARV